jgi:molybdopterin-synthase adenylyltransferase
MVNERFDRQLLLFGKEGQAKIEKAKVGIVGLGGLGSQITQALVYLGVRDFVLVDDDPADMSNLNRLVGASITDGQAKIPKVEIAERIIKAIIPDAKVLPLRINLRTCLAITSLISCSHIFGCVDNDGARLILSELAASYSITLFDAATEIVPQENKPLLFGGRVVVARPGDFCLTCAGEIDMAIAKEELDSPQAQEVRRAHGYGLRDQDPAPAVVSLNGIVANLAVTEFMMMVTGLREPNRYTHYRGERGVVLVRDNKSDPDCYTCHFLAGKGSQANIYRYILVTQT